MNGNGASEVKAVLGAAGRLASPGDILFNVAHAARETFALLDYAAKAKAKDLLAARLEVALKDWNKVIASFLRPQ